MMIKRVFFFLVLFFGISFGAKGQKIYVHAGHLFDGAGEELREEVTIIIDEGIIQSVEDGFLNLDEGGRVINLRDKTILPGLIDLHVHLENETGPDRYIERFTKNPEDIAFRSALYAKRTLLAGFTTVRDLGGTGVNTALRNAINEGTTEGPRVLSAGKTLATTGGHADPTNSYRND